MMHQKKQKDILSQETEELSWSVSSKKKKKTKKKKLNSNDDGKDDCTRSFDQGQMDLPNENYNGVSSYSLDNDKRKRKLKFNDNDNESSYNMDALDVPPKKKQLLSSSKEKRKKKKKKSKSKDDNLEKSICDESTLSDETIQSQLTVNCEEYEEMTPPVVKAEDESTLFWPDEKDILTSTPKKKRKKKKSRSKNDDFEKSIYDESVLLNESMQSCSGNDQEYVNVVPSSFNAKKKKKKKRSRSNDSIVKKDIYEQDTLLYEPVQSYQEEIMHPVEKPNEKDILLPLQDEKVTSPLLNSTKSIEKRKKKKKNIESSNGNSGDNNSDKGTLLNGSYNGDYNEVTFLAEKLRKREILSRKDQLYLSKLEVNLKHEVEPQHKIEARSGTHAPSRQEIQEFKKIATIKKGLFSPEEDEIIMNNWKEFCELHNWDVEKVQPFLSLRDSDRGLTNKRAIKPFVQFLSHGLPNRTLYSVYHRFKNLYSTHKVGRYTAEEDNMIINHIENNKHLNQKKKYTDLAKVLNRTRASLWRRYRLICKKKKSQCED